MNTSGWFRLVPAAPHPQGVSAARSVTSLPAVQRLDGGAFVARVALGLASLSAPMLIAQTRTASASDGAADKIVTLEEFNVSAANDGSYMPSESTTGSRVNAKVKDLPYAVSTLTSEFLRDFSIFEATEELSYMSSVSGVDDGGNLNLRGFNGGTNNLRNGLASNGLIDSASLDRIEVIKGPAAAIYGQTSPSGAMVVTTKRPTAVPRYGLSFSGGSYDLTQVMASASGPLRVGKGAPRLFYRFDGQYYHRHYEVPGLSSMTRSATLALAYRHSQNTHVTLDVGYLLRLNNAAGGLPFNYDFANRRYTGGYAFNVVKKTILNPVDQKPRWNAVGSLAIEHRFNAVLSGKFAASINHRPLVNYQSFGGSQYDPVLNRIVDGRTSISYAKDDFNYRNSAIDLTAANYSFAGARQRTLLTIDYSFQNRIGYSTTSTSAFNAANPGLSQAQKQVDTAFNLIPYQPVSVTVKGGPNFNPLTYVRDNSILAVGVFARQEATFRERTILVAGYRSDHIRADLREPGNRVQRKLDDRNDSLLLGLTYRVTPGISWYVSRNESFSPMSITTSANPTAATPQTTTGIGYETGIKGELFDGRLGFTANVYDTRRENEQVTEIDPSTGVTFTSYIGNTDTQGAELDLNYRLTQTFQALASYAFTDARAVNQGRDTDAEGRPTKGRPEHAFSAALRYQATRGLSLTLGVRYTGESPAFNPTEGATFAANGLYLRHNGARDVMVPSSIIWTAGASYRWKTERYFRGSHTFTLTGKNLTDRLYVVPGNNRSVGDRLGVYATYAVAR
ncbi:MAG: TonB-dependent receptor [Opitutaceae bacterium]